MADAGRRRFRAHPDTIPGLALAAAATAGEDPAIDDGPRQVTFGELLDSVWRVAGAFCELVGPAERIAIWAPNSIDWATAALGAAFAGATVVPVNTRYTTCEMADIVDRSGCRLVVAEHEFLGRSLAREALAGGDRRAVIGLGPGSEPGTVPLSSLLSADGGGAAVERRLGRLGPDSISHIQYTSGTTGRPKGAMLRHSSMVTTTREWARIVGLRSGDRYPVIAPFAHIGGHKTGLLACLASGATALPFATLDVERLAALIGAGGVSVLQGPPTMYQALIARWRDAEPAEAAPRVAVTGGATVAPALVREIVSVLGVRHVFTAYGLTETTGVCTMTGPADDVDTVAETSGRAIPGVEVLVVDQAGEVLPPGRTGQVVVGGDGVMAGYLDDPAATAEAVTAGRIRTGDIGWVGEDGCLRIVDRLKDLVIVGGLNAYPAEIERVLLECPGVDQAAVVGAPDDRLGEVPVAFVVLRTGLEPSIADLEAHCRSRLADFKRPRRFVVVDGLPVNSSGKVVKVDLRRHVAGWPPPHRAD